MATETLRIDVTVNNKTAIAGLKQTEAELGKVAAASLKTGAAVRTGSNQAANALNNLGRVAQDAPFGFIGIQNNLNPLLESFQQLKAQSGSTSTALKAMAGSLIGPAGLGLALSVGSALLLAFGDRLFSSKKKTEEASKASQEYKRALDEQSTAAANAVTKTAALVSAALSEEASLKQRKAILKELNKESSEYFGNLRIEKGQIVGLIEAYGLYAENIFKVAKAKGAAQQVEKLSKELLSSTTNLKGLTDELTNLSLESSLVGGPKQVEKNLNEIDGILKKVLFSQEDIKRVSDLTGMSEAKVNDLLKRRNIERTKELRLTAQILDLSKFANAETLSGLSIPDDKKPTKAEIKLAEYLKNIEKARLGFKKLGQGQPVTGNTPTDTSFQAVGPNQGMIDRTLAVQEATKRQLDYANALRLTTMNEEAAAAMTNVAMSAFTSLGNAMLQGQDIGEALGNVFKKLIVDLTSMIARALIFKAILAGLSGGTSAVAGAAGGGGFLDIFKGLLGFSDGGIASGPKSGYPVMLHGTEAVLNPKQFKNLTSNMMNMGAMQSQGGGMNLSGEFVVRGNDLVYVLNKQGFTNNLLGR